MVAAPPSRAALVPNAIAFRDPSRGVLGTGLEACADPTAHCRLAGTISLTSDGGRTWRVVVWTPRPVVAVAVDAQGSWARLDDGETLRSGDGGRTWAPAVPEPQPEAPCPLRLAVSLHEVVTTPKGREWAVCAGEGGAGAMAKAVYRLGPRGWRRLAWTSATERTGHGGLSNTGYPLGMAMADDGFGLIWEARGTLYVTRDGGSRWIGLAAVARPDVDFGDWAAVLPHGAGFALLSENDYERRLLETTDAGRTWRVVHRWR